MGVSTIDSVIVNVFLHLPWRWEILVVGRKKQGYRNTEVVVSVLVLFILMDAVKSLSQHCSYLFLMCPLFGKKIKGCKQKW